MQQNVLLPLTQQSQNVGLFCLFFFFFVCFQKKQTAPKACTGVFSVNLHLCIFSPFCQACSSLLTGIGHSAVLLPVLLPESPNLSCCSQPLSIKSFSFSRFIYLDSDHPAETSYSQREHGPFPKGIKEYSLAQTPVVRLLMNPLLSVH